LPAEVQIYLNKGGLLFLLALSGIARQNSPEMSKANDRLFVLNDPQFQSLIP
jgi:hypothetical protein